MGHIQLVHLPPCPPPQPIGPPSSAPPSRPPPNPAKPPPTIIIAHESALNTLSVPPSGRMLATTSSRGTLIRIWDTTTGKLIRELRRGSDKAEIYGVAFRPDEREVCVWSDKGTVHVFALTAGSGAACVSFAPRKSNVISSLRSSSNRQSTLSSLTSYVPLPKYFDSEWSYAQYRIPSQTSHISISGQPTRSPTADVVDEEKCVVGWIQVPSEDQDERGRALPAEHQLVALTYTGGWYRLSLPTSSSSSAAPPPHPPSPVPPPAPSLRDLGPLSTSPPSVKTISMAMARPRSSSGSSFGSRPDKGKDREEKPRRECILREYRRFGRWDGWG